MNQNLIKQLATVFLILAIVYMLAQQARRPEVMEPKFNQFLTQLRAGEIERITLSDESVSGKYRTEMQDGGQVPVPRTGKNFRLNLHTQQVELLTQEVDKYNSRPDVEPQFTTDLEYKPSGRWMSTLLPVVVPLLLFLAIWIFFMRQMQAGGNRAMSFGKARPRLNADGQQKVTFDDVAGCDEAKEELREVVEFLRDPRKFQRLGGKIPKGVLLFGLPGTGKTLLARAVAGEANVPFFSISGSEFVEMFVGVGASRVRDLFEQGKKNAPCIIFMDEIDAVGRYRFAGIGGGNDEREQTLNQLLVEMDGFTSNDEVILIAATNRPDVLDPALLRPGRFDRRITVLPPDVNGRLGILKVHTRHVVLGPDVDLEVLARRSPGMCGADLANAVNEAALLAARKNKDAVEMVDFEEAFDRVLAGPELRSRRMSEHERRITAYHEAGHALLQYLLEEVDPLHKVTILPRGRALGYSMSLPPEDRYNKTRRMLLGEIVVALGGRVSEEMMCGDVTTGARQDIEMATEQARRMVCEYGMSERLGTMALGRSEPGEVFLGRDLMRERNYSEQVAAEIDHEVRSIIQQCAQRAQRILEENRDKLVALAEALLEREVMDAEDVEQLFNGTLPAVQRPADSGPAPGLAVPESGKIADPRHESTPLTHPGESPAFG